MKKKTLIIFLVYLLTLCSIYYLSTTLSKYSSQHNPTGEFPLGERLFINYERGKVYRNYREVEFTQINEGEIGSDGKVAKTRRIEIFNIAPSDYLVYTFYVMNYETYKVKNSEGIMEDYIDEAGNKVITNKNQIDGIFLVSTSAILAMPAHKAHYELKCTLSYRQVYSDGSTSEWMDFVSSTEKNLPTHSQEVMKYEFEVTVLIDDQIETTTNDDYLGANLTISIIVDAASDVE